MKVTTVDEDVGNTLSSYASKLYFSEISNSYRTKTVCSTLPYKVLCIILYSKAFLWGKHITLHTVQKDMDVWEIQGRDVKFFLVFVLREYIGMFVYLHTQYIAHIKWRREMTTILCEGESGKNERETQ